ncbi:PspC domain-containing protein [bacterium]|nr:PspC domain-containing protein [bacterium]
MKEKPTAELRAEQRKLLRSRRNRKIAGVCGGLGEYFNIDPTWVRLGWIFLSLLSSIILGLVVYIILVIVLPEEK